MKLIDIVATADILLSTGLGTLLDKQQMDAELTQQLATNVKLKRLIDCANLTLNEIATTYVPVKYVQTITPNLKGIVLYLDFEHDLNQVLKITDCKTKRNLKYRYLPEGIDVFGNGDVEIVYSAVPPSLTLFDVVVKGSPDITQRLVAYGVCAEYCLLTGTYEDANVWDKRFKEGLMNISSKKSQIVMPTREFV